MLKRNFMKIRLLGAELFHTDMRLEGRTDGQTDTHVKDDSHFSQFCERTLKSAAVSTT